MAETLKEYLAQGTTSLPKPEMEKLIKELEANITSAAQHLGFEKAAALRDQICELQEVLAEEGDYKPWEKMRILAGES
jgi:excinuclease UvrABC helicase subunit UvrB